MHGSMGGRWRNGTNLRGPLVPGRRLEHAATMTSSGPQPQQRSAKPAAYLTDSVGVDGSRIRVKGLLSWDDVGV